MSRTLRFVRRVCWVCMEHAVKEDKRLWTWHVFGKLVHKVMLMFVLLGWTDRISGIVSFKSLNVWKCVSTFRINSMKEHHFYPGYDMNLRTEPWPNKYYSASVKAHVVFVHLAWQMLHDLNCYLCKSSCGVNKRNTVESEASSLHADGKLGRRFTAKHNAKFS